MKTTLLRAGALSCALLASTALTTPALAQSAPPPTNHNVDANGVDVILRRFEMSQTLVSIGPDWPHGLSYVRSLNDGEWVSNFTGSVFQSANRVTVSAGTSAAVFTYSGGSSLNNAGTFSPDEADGSTLTRSGGTFTYTNRNGVVARLSAVITSGHIVAGTGRLIDVQYPNGSLVTVNYRTENVCDENQQNCVPHFRPQSITNNFNYQLHLGYAEDDPVTEENSGAWHQLTSVRAINTAVESCDPYADSCSLTGNWPVATLAFATDPSREMVTLPDGNVWEYRSTPSQLGIRRPGSTSDDVTIDYDSFHQVQSITGLTGTWTYAYTPGSGGTGTIVVSGPLGGSRTVVADMNKLLITSDQDALGRTTSYQYDGNDRLTRITAPEGNYVNYTYDSRGNITEERYVAKSGSGLPDMVTTASYSSTCSSQLVCNQPNSVTDTRGNTTDLTYSTTHGGILTMTAPAPVTSGVRPQTRYGYTSATVGGQTVYLPSSAAACQTLSSCTGGADESVTTVSYSGSNFLLTSMANGNGTGSLTSTTAVTYDDIGNPITQDGPLSGSADTTRIRYNALRQVVGAISADPDGGGSLKHRAVRTTYDVAGLPSAVEVGTVNSQSDGDWASMTVLQRTETDRDALGRPVAQRLTSGGTTYALTQTSYDARGRVDCVAQRMNPSEFATPPSSACTLDTQGSYGPDRITHLNYDAAGQVTSTETGYGVTGVVADEASLTYRANGQVETVTDANGNKTTYVYDGHDRLSRTRMPHPSTAGTSSTTDYEELTYATATVGGNTVATPLVSSLRTRDGSAIGFTYDNLGRLTARDLPSSPWYNRDRAYTYNNFGQLLTASGNQSYSYTYDALGRMTQEYTFLGPVDYQYDAAGRRTRMTWPDSFYVDYDHLVTGEVSVIRENGASSGAGVLGTYAYDDLGRRTSLTRGNSTTTSYSYDAVSRLTGLTQNLNGSGSDVTFGYTYNPAGEIASHTRSNDAYAYTGHANANVTTAVNGLNQVTTIGGSSVTHDSNGNVASVPAAGSLTGAARSFSYDSANALIAVSGTSAYQEMSQDSLDRLLAYYDGSAYRFFIYDGEQMVAETNNAGTAIARRYVPGPGSDEPLAWYEGSGTSDRRWFHADERGSVVAVSDGSGDLIGSNPNRYDEYGVPQGTLTGRFGFTGQAWLPEAGLYHYRARTYNPTTGRFLQTDPIGFDGGMNLYAYVRNNPVNFVDPLGLEDVTVTGEPLPGGMTELPNFVRSGSPAHSIPNSSQLENPGECTNADCSDFTVRWRRPERAVPGGYISRAQACLGSCHGVRVPFGRRYSTPDEDAALTNLTIEGLSQLPMFRPVRGVRARGLCGCLVAGTMVLTPNGPTPIEQIRVGDRVLAINEQTGEVAAKPVTALVRPAPKPVYALSVRNAQGVIEIFNATDDHPWRLQNGDWVETTALRMGDRIDTISDQNVVVVSLESTSRVEETFNLTVDGWHTFFIGKDGVVVHNACSPNQIRQQIRKDQQPRGVESIHTPHTPGDQVHIHVNGGALNRDGTWRHTPDRGLNNEQRGWLESVGWTVP